MSKSWPSIRRLRRSCEIADTFIRHGFGFLFHQLETNQPSWGRALWLPSQRKTTSQPEDPATHFRLALEELGPTFVKFGQILSTRPDLLPPAYIAELGKLVDTVPGERWEAIRAVMTRELGQEPEKVFATIDPQPIGAASLAQVHAATLPDGQEVVVKVQRPDIILTIETDLEILSGLAERAQTTSLGKRYDFVGVVDDFALRLNPDFDVFAVAEPYVRGLMKHLVLPDAGSGRTILVDSVNWRDLLHRLPRVGQRMMERIERNQPFHIQIKDTDRALVKLDQLATRLSLSLLVAAFIIGLPLLLPLTAPGSLPRWLIMMALIPVIVAGLWFVNSLLSTPRK
jgi:ubiquinone biosynthesis protein